MKRFHGTIIAAAALFCVSVSLAQQATVRVGIMPFGGGGIKAVSQKSDDVVSGLSAALHSFRFIALVEQAEIARITEEMEKGQSGLIDESTAARAGKIHGIQVMVMGTVSGSLVSGRAVHVETGKIIATASGTLSDIDSLGEKLASGIESYLARETLKHLRNDSPEVDFRFWAERPGQASRGLSVGGKAKIGDKITFRFKSSADGYCTIVDMQPNGDVVVLFPNDTQPDNRVAAGREYSVPSSDDAFEITVTEPAGIDTVVAFFTKRKVDWLDRSRLEGEGFLTVKREERYTMSRGLSVTATKLKSADWETGSITLEVER